MGKYSKVIPNLPKFAAQVNPQWQDKVNARKKEIVAELGAALDPSSLTRVYLMTRAEKDEHETKEKQINIDLEAITQLVIDQYEIEGLTSQKLDTGESVSVQYAPYAVVKDKDKVRVWAIANGMERELQLHWKTLNTIASESLLKGENPPDGVEIFSKGKLVARGRNKGGNGDEE